MMLMNPIIHFACTILIVFQFGWVSTTLSSEIVVPKTQCLDAECVRRAISFKTSNWDNITIDVVRSGDNGTGDAASCHYRGYSTGAIEWAVLDMCEEGVVVGVFQNKDKALGELTFDRHSKRHKFEVGSSEKREFCGTSDSSKFQLPPDREQTRSEPTLDREFVYFVELFVIMSFSSHSQFHNSNVTSSVQYIETMVTIMNVLMKDLNVHVILNGIEIWTEEDRVDGSFVRQVANYTHNSIFGRRRYDAAFLLHPEIFFRTLGVVRNFFPCEAFMSVGVIATGNSNFLPIRPRPLREVSKVAAHELGHLLGFTHTDTLVKDQARTPSLVNCECQTDPDQECVMNSSSSNSTQWSQCSRDILRDRRITGINSCIYQPPTPSDGQQVRPICGNGFVERGEECDCTATDLLCQMCCNTNTCRLIERSQCATGPCCVDCSFRTAGFECRRPSNSACDGGGQCNGTSSECPVEGFFADGMDCVEGGQDGTCFRGQCHSRQAQCKSIAGGSATDCSLEFYDFQNVKGERFGHCLSIGFNGTGSSIVRPCLPQDVLCGQLICRFDALDQYYKRLGTDGEIFLLENSTDTSDGRTCNMYFNPSNNLHLAQNGTIWPLVASVIFASVTFAPLRSQ